MTGIHSVRLRSAALFHSALACSLTISSVLAAPRTDVLTLDNGDRITGEISALSRGQLEYKTDDAGTLKIEWENIQRLTSSRSYEVEVSSGEKYFGRLAYSATDGDLVIDSEPPQTLHIVDVVRLEPIDSRIRDRLKAYLDVGYTYAKANAATTLSIGSQLAYRGPKVGSSVTYSSYAQGQQDIPTATRSTLSLKAARYLANRWSVFGLSQYEQNDELDLAYRITAGSGPARILSQTNHREITLGGGLVATKERFDNSLSGGGSGTTERSSIEGLLLFSWDAFRFDTPKLDFVTTLAVFPSATSWPRVRGELNNRIRFEVFKDFFVALNLTDTFDSKPPDATATKNDFVTSLGIEWSYRR